MAPKKKAKSLSRRILWRLVLLALTVAALFWRGEWLWRRLLQEFGWGLLLVALWLGAIAWFWTHPKHLRRFWRQTIGAILLSLALFAGLAIFHNGGDLGKELLGPRLWVGIPKIAALAFLGMAFMAPRQTFSATSLFFRGLANLPRHNPLAWLLGRLRPKPKAQAQAAPPARQPSPRLAQVQERSRQLLGLGKQEKPTPAPLTPPYDLLEKGAEATFSQADQERRARLVEEALASYGIEGKVVEINPGPTVTQFGVQPGWMRRYKEVKERDANGNIRTRQREVSRTRVKVDSITNLDKDLALALAAPSIRIEAPVPGKPLVGIEVPNATLGLVHLRSVIETTTFKKLLARTKLAVALGKGAGGETVVADLGKMPHLLIAGATGSGKSVCINTIIVGLLLHCTPEEVRFLMVDPKRVELVSYNGIPHLITRVVVDMDKVLVSLKWASQEMDRRYRLLEEARARNIEAFNQSPRAREHLPYLVVVIDELADVIMTAPYEVEQTLCRLAQLGRAVGIHLVLATQRPSVDIITGLIKANFPTRISFAVTSQVDSRVILDVGGAEKLLGRGDMLYLPQDVVKPKRLQGAYVSDQEIEKVVGFWTGRAAAGPVTPSLIEEAIAQAASREGEDPLLAQARELASKYSRLSASLLQRRLRVGYPRAARLLDELEAAGVVGPGEPGKSRPVLRQEKKE